MGALRYNRWHDRDPALGQALESLQEAPDKYQALVALNIILVIVEHQIENQSLTDVEALLTTLQQSAHDCEGYHRRWYDANLTLKSALQMLQECPDEVQQEVMPNICAVVENTLQALYAA